ncbi:hypothetical protein [Lysinibacillus xylanilyticus]|uniref:hypothetical protein n=1 Tax=Lysinibacillus xylanilyticus TaxID=582475 RepID=UPI0036DBB074
MANITYDYHALKDAHKNLVSEVEAFKENAKQLAEAGTELVAENNSEGVKSTMASLDDKQKAVIVIMDDLVEQSATALAQARELHVAGGGEE